MGKHLKIYAALLISAVFIFKMAANGSVSNNYPAKLSAKKNCFSSVIQENPVFVSDNKDRAQSAEDIFEEGSDNDDDDFSKEHASFCTQVLYFSSISETGDIDKNILSVNRQSSVTSARYLACRVFRI